MLIILILIIIIMITLLHLIPYILHLKFINTLSTWLCAPDFSCLAWSGGGESGPVLVTPVQDGGLQAGGDDLPSWRWGLWGPTWRKAPGWPRTDRSGPLPSWSSPPFSWTKTENFKFIETIFLSCEDLCSLRSLALLKFN